MKNIFREYDIRGIFKKELNEDIVKKIGYFLGLRIKKHQKYTVVGYDARIHSLTLLKWLASGLNKAGITVLNSGLVPTPVVYFSNYTDFNIDKKKVSVSSSIMITGSHNPKEYNGFKITLNKTPFFGKDIQSLAKEVLNSDIKIEDNPVFLEIDAKEKYVSFLTKEFEKLAFLDKKVIVDCGNGAVGVVIERILKNLKIDYELLYCKPDGNFPNHHPDPSVEKN
jgi:phosphomannomutase/phosphoglucomutase